MTNFHIVSKAHEVALLREASFSSMAIGVGLTHIRKYWISSTGFFYSGLLSYCTGIERLLKIIVIYDYRIKNNNAFPTDNILKQKSHGIKDLITFALASAAEHKISINDFTQSNIIYGKIFDFLNDFAFQARYYNLDSLTGKKQKADEPLARWDNEICSEILKIHPVNAEALKAAKQYAAQAAKNKKVFVQHHSESGREINDYQDFLLHNFIAPTKQKYSMFYLAKIAGLLSEICEGLEHKFGFYPHLREFFLVFIGNTNTDILRKKSWNPLPPYHF